MPINLSILDFKVQSVQVELLLFVSINLSILDFKEVLAGTEITSTLL